MSANKSYERPKDFIDPGLPSKCTWHLKTKEKSPHTQRGIPHRQKNHTQYFRCHRLYAIGEIESYSSI